MRGRRHSLLRTGTAAIHAAVERVVDTHGYFERSDRYRDYLWRMLAFHRRLDEGMASPALDTLARWRIDGRAAWLAADLSALGARPEEVLVTRSAAPALALPSDPGGVLGILYVLVGSGLGACELARRCDRLCLPEGRGRSYLQGLCTNTHWPTFLALLEREPIACEQQMLNGAIGTFTGVLETLTDKSPA